MQMHRFYMPLCNTPLIPQDANYNHRVFKPKRMQAFIQRERLKEGLASNFPDTARPRADHACKSSITNIIAGIMIFEILRHFT